MDNLPLGRHASSRSASSNAFTVFLSSDICRNIGSYWLKSLATENWMIKILLSICCYVLKVLRPLHKLLISFHKYHTFWRRDRIWNCRWVTILADQLSTTILMWAVWYLPFMCYSSCKNVSYYGRYNINNLKENIQMTYMLYGNELAFFRIIWFLKYLYLHSQSGWSRKHTKRKCWFVARFKCSRKY